MQKVRLHGGTLALVISVKKTLTYQIVNIDISHLLSSIVTAKFAIFRAKVWITLLMGPYATLE